MKYFETFAGIGGFRVGIQNAYTQYALEREKSEQEERSQGGERSTNQRGVLLHPRNWPAPLCIGYSEIDRYAIKVYEKQFGGTNESTSNQTRGEQPREERQHERSDVHTESIGKTTYNNVQPPRNYGDITKINAEELPDFDCLVGGFPCQSFSIAGKRRGFEDTRGTLFFELARILRAKQPRLFVFENVKGLLSHDNGNTFRTIIATIDELGYDCQWQVLNSKDFGVPQNRERVILVGHLRGTPRPQVFPIIGANSQDIKQINNPKHSNNRIFSTEGVSPTLNTAQGGNRQPKITIPVLTPDRPEKRQNGRRLKTDGEPSFTLTAQDKHGVYDGAKIRRLTPLECERLQAFPDDWTKYGVQDGVQVAISDSQRYKMCGNAVTTNVIQAVFERIFRSEI